MSLNIGELVGYVKIDHSAVRPGMDAAEREVKAGMTRTAAEAGRGGQEVGKKFGAGTVASVTGSLKTLSTAIVGGFAIDRVVGFIGDTMSAASDLQQSIGGVDAVFGRYAENIHTKSAQAAQDLGLSKNAYNELITVSAAMLKNKGLDDFAEQSENLVKIGADLAAQYGGPTTEAVEALNAAMRGESDPIERYGISLNEAAVNAKLAELGLTGLTGAQAEAAKTQARLAIITDQSKDALGAFTREADTAAGKQARLSAEWENQKAALGDKLLPVMVAVTDFASGTLVPTFSAIVESISGVASVANSLPGPVKGAIVALTLFHLLKGPLGSMLDSTRTKVTGLAGSMKGLSAAGAAKAGLSGLIGAFGGPFGIAVGVGTVALTHFWQEAEKVNQIADTLKSTIDKTTGAFSAQGKTAAKESLLGDLSTDDVKLLQDLGVNFDVLADAAGKGGPEFDEQRKKLVDLMDEHQAGLGVFSSEGRATEGLLRSYDRLGDGTERARLLAKELPPEIEKTGDAAAAAGPKVEDYAEVHDKLTEASQKAADLQKQLAQAMLDVNDAAVTADQAEAAWQESLDQTAKSIEENGKTVTLHGKKVRDHGDALNLDTQAGRDNQESLVGLRDAALDNAKAMLTQGDSTDVVKGKLALAREEFIRNAEKMGLTESAANTLADQYGITSGSVDTLKASMDKIPSEIKTEIQAAIGEAMEELGKLKIQLTAPWLDDQTVNILLKFQTQGARAAAALAQSYKNQAAIADLRSAEGGPVHARSMGGPVVGPGTSTSDSVPAIARSAGGDITRYALSDGEWISNASSTSRNRAALDAANHGALLGVMDPRGGAPAQSGPMELSNRTLRKLAEILAGIRPAVDLDRLSSALGGD